MIDPTKTYRTRNGREVRIYATDGGGSRPVHGAIKDGERWSQSVWSQDGSWFGSVADDYDLIEVKPRIKCEAWVNVYPGGIDSAQLHRTKEEAERGAGRRRIACVRVTIDCEEGEGL